MPPDLLAFDNALVDILIQVTDRELEALRLEKGVCNYPSDEQLGRLHEHVSGASAIVEPGGSAANTATLMARLGASVCFFSAAGTDAYGDLYERDLRACRVQPCLTRVALVPTGTAMTFITPDAQRTFAVHLGAATHLSTRDIPAQATDAAIVYLTAYVLEHPNTRSVALELMRSAKGTIALDLSDPALIRRSRELVLRAVRDHADIVFANEPEARALTGKDAPLALEELSSMARVAIVKVGKDGSLIREGNRTIHAKAHVVSAIDTTGAGDAYAAGFLLGYLKGKSLEICGELGSLLASKVITHIGARLSAIPEHDVKKLLS
jgi:sugar/nucleoside kinase (ribokinase family)